MTTLLVQLLLSYLIGSVSGSLLLGRLRGIDIRTEGSGNAGTTNALRTQGKLFAVAVLLIDVLKGVLAVAVVPKIDWFATVGSALVEAEVVPLICGVAVALGHIFPVFFGFRGGRGAATLLGVYLVIAPLAVIWALAFFLVLLILTGMAGLATISAAAATVVGVLVSYDTAPQAPLAVFSYVMFALMLLTHRENILRMIGRQENQFERVMLLRRLNSRRSDSRD